MYRPKLGRQALMLGLLVTLVVLAVNACGGGQEQADRPRPLPEDEKALSPGEYHSVKFKPSLSFRLGKGLTSAPPLLPDYIEIDGPDGGPSRWIRFSNVKEVYKPGTLGSSSEVVKAPKDLVGWFQDHPYLKTSKPQPVTVGGVKGMLFDVVVKNLPKDYYGMCGSDCVDIYSLSGGEKILAYLEPKKRKVIVLEDVKGSTVAIDFGSSASDFHDFLPEAQKVVKSVKWGGS
jgi:hypothetical protein